MLTYEEFMSMIPKETEQFINQLLPCIDYYIGRDKDLKVWVYGGNSEQASNESSKILFLCFSILNQNPKYKSFLQKYSFKSEKISFDKACIESMRITPGTKTSKELFERYRYLFQIYKDHTKYYGMLPIDIIKPQFEKYMKICQPVIFAILFPSIQIDKFYNELIELNQTTKKQIENKIEQQIHGNLPVAVISYLETATKIRELLNCSDKWNNGNDEDTVTISLLLSLYDENETSENNPTNEKSNIVDYLKEKGITKSKILKVIDEESSDIFNSIDQTTKNIYAFKYLYMKYYQEGINKDREEQTITISSILTNALDREFTGSLLIERILLKLNCQISEFQKLEQDVLEHIEKRKLNAVSELYTGLTKKTKEFLDFTGKTYLLIQEKMKDQTYNNEILIDDNDVTELALYIAICYSNGEVSEFFSDHNLTLENVLSTLNLSITKEEINNITLQDKRFIVDHYGKYLKVRKIKKDITINDIFYKLCNPETSQKMLMQKIANYLEINISIELEFENQVERYFKQKKEKHKKELEKEFFSEMQEETIVYLKRVTRIHNFIKKIENIPFFALLLGITNYYRETEIQQFYESINITKAKIYDYMNIDLDYFSSNDFDIELLIQEYKPFIFEGANKNVPKNEITIFNIARNAFCKELYYSESVERFLKQINLSYDIYNNIETLYQEFKEKRKQKDDHLKLKEYLKVMNDHTSEYIYKSFHIHHRIMTELEKNEKAAIDLKKPEDIVVLSLILGLFWIDNELRYYFEKNGLTQNSIYKAIGLESTDFQYQIEDKNYAQFSNLYKKYIDDSHPSDISISDIIQRIFDEKINTDSHILEQITNYYGINFEKLKKEVTMQMDYEATLTMSERIQMLANEKISSLDLNNLESVLQFGDSLSSHSKFIHEELLRLMLNDGNEESIETINNMIARVYQPVEKEEKKTNFLSRFLHFSIEEETPKMTLNMNAIQELKEEIENNIKRLSDELLGYDTVRKYIEVYYQKNYAHYMIVSNETKKLESEVGTLNPENNESYIKFLEATSHLQIMRDKENRFSTSNHLMKQELMKVNRAIVNHFITINALEMARDDLLPLIGSELALAKGRETENQALDLSQNVMDLFQSILTRNVESAEKNIEKLKNSSIPDEIFNLINHETEIYLRELDHASHTEEPQITTNDTPILLLSEKEPKEKQEGKEKRIEYPKR